MCPSYVVREWHLARLILKRTLAKNHFRMSLFNNILLHLACNSMKKPLNLLLCMCLSRFPTRRQNSCRLSFCQHVKLSNCRTCSFVNRQFVDVKIGRHTNSSTIKQNVNLHVMTQHIGLFFLATHMSLRAH
jgi:hypothetical protein